MDVAVARAAEGGVRRRPARGGVGRRRVGGADGAQPRRRRREPLVGLGAEDDGGAQRRQRAEQLLVDGEPHVEQVLEALRRGAFAGVGAAPAAAAAPGIGCHSQPHLAATSAQHSGWRSTKAKAARRAPKSACRKGAISTFSGLLSSITRPGGQNRRQSAHSAARARAVSSGDSAVGWARSARSGACFASKTA